jgi:hypothetical protein
MSEAAIREPEQIRQDCALKVRRVETSSDSPCPRKPRCHSGYGNPSGQA